MEQIIVTHPDGSQTPLLSKENVCAIKSAEQKVSLLGEDIVVISVQSAEPIEFRLGDRIDVFGKTYTLNQLPAVKKTGERIFDYNLNFEGVQYELLDAQFLLPDSTVGDSFTGNLLSFLEILVSNANRVFSGKWIVGECPNETEYKTLTFSAENCLAVLQNICEEYSQEFEIEQDDKGSNGIRTLHIRTAGAAFPYTFRYGRTGGLYELTRQNINSKNIATRLFAYGGNRNIPNSYLTARNSNKLCLPAKNKNTSYIQNAVAVDAFGIKENTKTFDEIFPNRYGEVTARGDKYYAFVDDTMNFDLNEKDTEGNTKWLISGVNATVHFNTGNLAGYEFDVHKYDHATKTIELVSFKDENGLEFPDQTSAAFQFAAGDKYFFIDINLPDAYITEAEQKLQTEAAEYYNQNSQPQVQYGLQIDENFIKQFAGELTVVNLFAVGDYIHVQDSDISVDKSIRITAYTRDLLRTYKYSITLGESVTKSIITRLIAEQKGIDKIIEINNLANPAKARRRWRDGQELLSMVFDVEGDYYTEKIKPLSIDTSLLSVGAKSTQFGLSGTVFQPNYGGNKNEIKVTGGTLVHYTIDENATKTWTLASNTTTLDTDSKAYYIYAKCQRSGNAGNIIFSTAQINVESDTDYYHFWIGIVNSVDETMNVRSIALSYGFSMVNGRFIKTGRIESSGGTGSFFDLDNNQFKIGDSTKGLSWNENNNGKLVLKGTMVQSQSGVEQPVGVFRGAYNSSYTYYQGDEVTYNGSTYRYINDTASSNKVPENTAYWAVIASRGDAPALVFRGDYSSSAIYYGTTTRVDAVQYNGTYYVARIDAGNGFTNKVPTTTYWSIFGTQFESVATKLLLAEFANIAGWILKNNKLISQIGTINNVDSTNYTNANFVPKVFLDGITGQVSFAGGKILLNADGSGQLANGNISWDASGNATMNNVIANNGTFNGIINAIGGIQLKSRVVYFTDSNDTTIATDQDCIIIAKGDIGQSDSSKIPFINLRGTLEGKTIIIKNMLEYASNVTVNSINLTYDGYASSYNTYIYKGRAKIYVRTLNEWHVISKYEN
jgi:hypothetical protein